MRYAILHHTGIPEPHFDLLFETFDGSDLAAWRSPVWPIVAATPIVRLRDHRRVYLDFEGELSQRRGTVERIAGGTCTVTIEQAARWIVHLSSGHHSIALQLQQISAEQWTASPVG